MRRFITAGCIACLLMATAPTQAAAWHNGSPRDGFGTHDWLLRHAIAIAGQDAAWVDETEALLTTDDPDNWRDDYEYDSPQFRTEQPLHLYLPDSAKQGGPQAVVDHYAALTRALSVDDTLTASRELGVLSHYYSDMLVPFHTFSYGTGSLEDGVDHYNYEAAITSATDSPDAHPGWVIALPSRPMADVRARAVEAALLSRSKTLELIARYGSFDGYDPAGDPTTQALLNRAANDLADLIRAANAGTGTPRPLGSIAAWADYDYPALSRPARVGVRVLDDQGNLVRGAKVTYLFNVTQPCSYTRYTESNGIARQAHANVLGTIGVPFDVVVAAASAGTTLTARVALTPTRIIGRGSEGIQAYTKYDATPAQGTTATIMTHIQDDDGNPIKGVKVVYTFKYKTKSVKQTVYTNSSGNAWHRRAIGNATPGYRVVVRVDAYGGTEPDNTYDGKRTAYTSFTPHSRVSSFKSALRGSAKPSQGTTVTVRAKCADENGAPIVGRTVKFSWKHKYRTYTKYAKSDSNGYAFSVRNIEKATPGYKVEVVSSVKSGSDTKKSRVAFTPVKP